MRKIKQEEQMKKIVIVLTEKEHKALLHYQEGFERMVYCAFKDVAALKRAVKNIKHPKYPDVKKGQTIKL